MTPYDDILIFWGVFRPILGYFITFLTQNFQEILVRRTLSWLVSFKAFEKIPRSQIIKTSSKRGHFCKFFCVGAIPFIIAHHGFHHSMRKCLKYLGYQGIAAMQINFQKWPIWDEILTFWGYSGLFWGTSLNFFNTEFPENVNEDNIVLTFEFQDIWKCFKGSNYQISSKMGHFSVFLCIGAKPFIIAHHGLHHSVGRGLKYLGYQGYIYTHSPLRGSQLSPKKPRKQYFSRLCQKVDFVGLFSRL